MKRVLIVLAGVLAGVSSLVVAWAIFGMPGIPIVAAALLAWGGYAWRATVARRPQGRKAHRALVIPGDPRPHEDPDFELDMLEILSRSGGGAPG